MSYKVIHKARFGFLVCCGLVGASTIPTAPATAQPLERQLVHVGPAAERAVIHGRALSVDTRALTDVKVRLRDARRGHIVDTATTDKAGSFEFRDVDPGSYIVEVMGDERVLAASELLHINARDAVSAIIRLPFRTPPLAGILGRTASSAAIVTATAAASGLLAVQVAGNDVTPRK